MTPKTIFAGVFALLVLGGVAYWLLSGPAETETPGTTTGTSGGFYQSDVRIDPITGGPMEGSGGTTEPVADTDIETAYDALLEKLLAQRVPFARVSSTEGTEGSVYALYAAAVADAKTSYPDADYSIGVAMIDITDDSAPEALVIEDLPGFCGSGGCPFSVYQKSGSEWKEIFSAQAQEVALANVITNGHLGLYIMSQGEGYESFVTLYAWEDDKYKSKEIAARWDGSAFVQYRQ